MTEVLQGVRTDQQARRVEKHLKAFDMLRLQHLDDFIRATGLYRRARSKGYTVRRKIDCLIAAVCIREHVPVLHDDADFDRLAEAPRSSCTRPRRRRRLNRPKGPAGRCGPARCTNRLAVVRPTDVGAPIATARRRR